MKPPWHLWVVGIVSLLWNAVSAFDYLMVQTRSEKYMSNFTPEQLDYFYGFPVWATSAWAVAVWFSVLGSILLLARSRHAVVVFALSFLGMIATSSYSFLLSGGLKSELLGATALAFSLAIAVVGLLLILYARAMRQRAILR